MATKTLLTFVNNCSLRERDGKPGQIVRVLGGIRMIKPQTLNVIRAESSYSLQRLFREKEYSYPRRFNIWKTFRND